jgi:hypothetical protein
VIDPQQQLEKRLESPDIRIDPESD